MEDSNKLEELDKIYLMEYLGVNQEYIKLHPSIEKIYRGNELRKFKKIITQDRDLLDLLSNWILKEFKVSEIERIINLKEIKENPKLLTKNTFKKNSK